MGILMVFSAGRNCNLYDHPCAWCATLAK